MCVVCVRGVMGKHGVKVGHFSPLMIVRTGVRGRSPSASIDMIYA